MQDQFGADAANHALEILRVREGASETRAVPVGRMMNENNAHMPGPARFGEKPCRRLAL